ncbi:chemotaxis protein CheB [Luteimonas aquatica]|uniref:chemotaxis protein CheB n=1 Tax=Luteimonas aquatica TaxID=450364 RepID=UPI001F572B60|nr:chemotaxis protein CheB [Luteimonas aquatica]
MIFEEAEFVAHRAGWDAARWVRHLGAKLRRHGEVLPPRREDEAEAEAANERAAIPAAGEDSLAGMAMPAEDQAEVAGEPAQAEAVESERSALDTEAADDGVAETEAEAVMVLAAPEASAHDQPLVETVEAPTATAEDAASPASDAQVQAPVVETVAGSDRAPATDAVHVEETQATGTDLAPPVMTEAAEFPPTGTGEAEDAGPQEAPGVEALELADATGIGESGLPSPDNAVDEMAVEKMAVEAFEWEEVDGSFEAMATEDAEVEPARMATGDDAAEADDAIDGPAGGFDADVAENAAPRPGFTPLPLVDVDALFASLSSGESAGRAPGQRADDAVRETDATAPAAETADAGDAAAWALVDDDTPAEATAAPEAVAVQHDLQALEARISGLSLADTDSYGHGPPRGAVLVEAGLGGPDAVRQLLAALPETFARPILVRLQLDGGRYDRLVRQMERVAKLPVALASAERPADAGTVYFMAPGLSLQRQGARLSFVDADIDPATDLLSALPGEDSAHLFLSGSDPALIDGAVAHIDAGGLLAAQATDGCYDSTAPSALIARGAVAGTPAELAARLVERWPS